jgi:hypothetical protein
MLLYSLLGNGTNAVADSRGGFGGFKKLKANVAVLPKKIHEFPF